MSGDNLKAREEGKLAFIGSKGRDACPYRGTKNQALARVEWLIGYADQAKQEAADWADWWHANFAQSGRLEGDETPTHWMPLPDEPKASQPASSEERSDTEPNHAETLA